MKAKRWWRRPRWIALAVLLVVAGAAGFRTTLFPGSPSDAAGGREPAGNQATPHGNPTRPTAEAAAAATVLGPDGVESSEVITENNLSGSASWQIAGVTKTGYIEGFADLNYAADGQQVDLYVSTTAARFRVVAYRMGWYHGAGARPVWTSPPVSGHVQPSCPVTAGINMVTCDNWTSNLTVPITSSFVPGDYLLKLIGSDNEQGYIPLTIWDPTSTATYLLVNRSLTEEGWNAFGGYSYYEGEGACTLGQTGTYPACNRARVVSFDRPYDTGYGASDFLENEYPLITFMEQEGLDVAYVTDVTLDEHPDIVLRHRALLSLGHDETWTYNEKHAAETALARGVNLAFLGAAAILRHSRLETSPVGPDRLEVDYRDAGEDPLSGMGDPSQVTSNTWESPPTNWSSTAFIGQQYSGFLNAGYAVPLVVHDANAWIFKGTGLMDGATVPGVIASDFDHIVPYQPTPPDLQVLAHSPIPLFEAFTTSGAWAGYTYSDMTYYTDTRSQGGVFDSGTVSLITTLTPCPAAPTQCPSTIVRRMTGNLLWLFGQGPAGKFVASVANWKQVFPAGS
jgi:hypothetical protein